jgi:hypothetical protein
MTVRVSTFCESFPGQQWAFPGMTKVDVPGEIPAFAERRSMKVSGAVRKARPKTTV